MTALYRRLLGSAFDTLPPFLQDLHDVTSTWKGYAHFKVTRGRGWLRRLAANVGRLPPEGEFDLRLTLVAEGERERWIREFADFRMESVQWTSQGLLMEQIGAVRFGFRVQVEPPVLRLVQVRTWILGVPWPCALGPWGCGEEVGQAEGCAVRVQALAPLLGRVVQYEGFLRKGEGPAREPGLIAGTNHS